jgi:putative sugar O-methyltransferase
VHSGVIKLAQKCPQDPDDLLREMMLDMRQQDSLYRPTVFWAAALKELGEVLIAENLPVFRRLPSAKRYFVPTYGLESLSHFGGDTVDEIRELLGDRIASGKSKHLFEALSNGAFLAASDYRAFRAGDRTESPPDLENCTESSVGSPDEQWEFDGNLYSRSMLNYLNGLVFLKQHIDTTQIQRVIEIGGGFGTLGEILLGDSDRDYTYVDVDIPPTALAAAYYLGTLFPEKFYGFQAAQGADQIHVDQLHGKCAVICPWQLEKLCGSFDLAVNFISFQEMEPAVVENYLAQLARLNCRFVLIRNLREGKPQRTSNRPSGVEKPICGPDYDRMFETCGYELVATNVYPFGFKTVDGFHSELRLFEKKRFEKQV